MDFYNTLSKQFTVKINEPLSDYTTWRVGGKAKYLVESRSSEHLITIVELCQKFNISYFILGRGANVLISDKAYDGLVIINLGSNIAINDEILEPMIYSNIQSVRTQSINGNNFINFDVLEIDQSACQRKIVKVESGANISTVFHKGLSFGLSGLQWYAGIPASVGGAVFNNIHGGNHYISEVIESVEIIDQNLELKLLSNLEMKFEYDFSILHLLKRPIVSVNFALYIDDPIRSLDTWNKWAILKKNQARNSAGSTWRNISIDEQKTANLESNSIGYILDKVLNLKGTRVGGAYLSSTGHSNFIETENGATAQNVLDLMEIIFNTVYLRLGVKLKPEIFFIGFSDEQLSCFL